MSYEVERITVPEQAVLVLGGRGPLGDIGRRLRRLRELVAQAGLTPAGLPQARFYEDDASSPTLDYDVCLPVEPGPDGSIPDTVDEARGDWIPRHNALQTTHVGPRTAMHDAWRAVNDTRVAYGYALAGPTTAIHVASGHEDDAHAPVTVIRQPYAR